jgi:hypothetical protein
LDEQQIMDEISRLVEEEHQLERGHLGKPLSDDQGEQVRSIHIARDRCWDLLRQVRARRNAGQDLGDVEMRPAAVVMSYRQ